jgi:hypothetical protein
MARKVDSEGEVTDPKAKVKDVSEPTAPLRVELPLWKFGRILFESRSQRASVAVVALLLMSALMPLLSFMSAFAEKDAGIAQLLGVLGQAWLLVLGVLLGAAGSNNSER